MEERNARYQLGGLLALDDAYFGGMSHGAGKRGHGTDQTEIDDATHLRHSVTQVLVLALAAVVAGQRSFIAIGDWIHDLNPEQRALFGCPRWGQTFKVPSEPTVRRVLQKMDADALNTVLNQWLTAEEMRVGDAIAIDGKNLRGSAHGHRKRPVHLLSGLVHRPGQVIGPVDVDIKTNEFPKLKDLLDPLSCFFSSGSRSCPMTPWMGWV